MYDTYKAQRAIPVRLTALKLNPFGWPFSFGPVGVAEALVVVVGPDQVVAALPVPVENVVVPFSGGLVMVDWMITLMSFDSLSKRFCSALASGLSPKGMLRKEILILKISLKKRNSHVISLPWARDRHRIEFSRSDELD